MLNRSRLASKMTTQGRRRLESTLKWICYALLFTAIFLYSTTISANTVKPRLFIPAALCIAMWEQELPSAFTGTAAGFMMDAAMAKLFGFNAFILTVVCMFVSLLFLYWLRQTFFNALWLSAAAILIQGLLDFLFFYAIWGHDNVGWLLLHNILPSMGFTLLLTCPLYLLIKIIKKHFNPPEKQRIEETSEDIVRE